MPSPHPTTERRPRRRLRQVAVVVAAGVLGIGASVVVGRASTETALDAASAGDSVIQQFPTRDRVAVEPFDAQLLDGTTFESASTAGQVTVYNVWGSWCGPCRAETPHLRRVAEETAGRVTFVGINVRDGRGAALAFERANKVPYPSIETADSAEALLSFGTSLGVTAVPTTIILDRDGGIAARVVGPATYTTLRALVDDALAEDPSAARSSYPGS